MTVNLDIQKDGFYPEPAHTQRSHLQTFQGLAAASLPRVRQSKGHVLAVSKDHPAVERMTMGPLYQKK